VSISLKLTAVRVLATSVAIGLGVAGYPTTTPTAPSGPTVPVSAPTTPAGPASSVTFLAEAGRALLSSGGPASRIVRSPAGGEYLTDDLSAVIVRRELAVYASPDFSPAADTGQRLKRRSKVRVAAVVQSAAGEPRLQVAGGFISAATADVRRPAIVPPKAKASLAVDLDTGAVLWQDGATKRARIASVTKLLSVFVVRDWIAAGGGTWQTRLTITQPNLVKMSKDWSTGGFKFKRGASYSVEDLYTLALVESSNAAITALGIGVAGSNEKFLDMMNAKAQEIGMESSNFISVSGLDNKSLKQFGLQLPGTSSKAGNISTAKDVGRLAGALIAKYPDVLETTSIIQTAIREKKVETTNQMLRGEKHYDKTLGVDGLKTGYTSAAGYCLAATSAKSGRHRVLVVILGAASSNARFKGASRLLHSVYDRWALRSAPEAG
jgi:D-alanyl-D-alanine carboxypeptidase